MGFITAAPLRVGSLSGEGCFVVLLALFKFLVKLLSVTIGFRADTPIKFLIRLLLNYKFPLLRCSSGIARDLPEPDEVRGVVLSFLHLQPFPKILKVLSDLSINT